MLGRTGERPGLATLRWDVTRLGHPVLRQFTDLAYRIYLVDRGTWRLAEIRDTAGLVASWGDPDRIEDLLMVAG